MFAVYRVNSSISSDLHTRETKVGLSKDYRTQIMQDGESERREEGIQLLCKCDVDSFSPLRSLTLT